MHSSKGNWDIAIIIIENSLAIRKRIDDARGTVQNYVHLGNIYTNKGEWQKAINLYQFRLGASQFFTGGSVSVISDAPAEEVTFKRKKKKNVVEGGC